MEYSRRRKGRVEVHANYPSTICPMDTEAGPLQDAQLQFFHTFGYLHLKRVFTLSDIAVLTQRANELAAKSTLVAGEFQPRGPAGDAEPYFMEPVIDRPCVLGAVAYVQNMFLVYPHPSQWLTQCRTVLCAGSS